VIPAGSAFAGLGDFLVEEDRADLDLTADFAGDFRTGLRAGLRAGFREDLVFEGMRVEGFRFRIQTNGRDVCHTGGGFQAS
jgi:hypothetical protein